MVKKRDVTITKKAFGTDTLEEDIQYWQSLGIEEIWRATREVTLLGYALKGVDITLDKIDKTIFIKKEVPWNSPDTKDTEDA